MEKKMFEDLINDNTVSIEKKDTGYKATIDLSYYNNHTNSKDNIGLLPFVISEMMEGPYRIHESNRFEVRKTDNGIIIWDTGEVDDEFSDYCLQSPSDISDIFYRRYDDTENNNFYGADIDINIINYLNKTLKTTAFNDWSDLPYVALDSVCEGIYTDEVVDIMNRQIFDSQFIDTIVGDKVFIFISELLYNNAGDDIYSVFSELYDSDIMVDMLYLATLCIEEIEDIAELESLLSLNDKLAIRKETLEYANLIENTCDNISNSDIERVFIMRRLSGIMT